LFTAVLLFLKKNRFPGRKTAIVANRGPLYPPGVAEGVERRRIIANESTLRRAKFMTMLYSIFPFLSILK
jgi:hypothetical protein